MTLDEADPKLSSIEYLILSFFDLFGSFLVLWIFMKYVDKKHFIKLGFYLKNRSYEIGIGLGIGALIMSLGYLMLLIFNQLHFQKFTFNFLEIINSIILFLIVAVVEEILLRGYVLRNLMVSFNKHIALIISAILFALMHGINPKYKSFSAIPILGGVLFFS